MTLQLSQLIVSRLYYCKKKMNHVHVISSEQFVFFERKYKWIWLVRDQIFWEAIRGLHDLIMWQPRLSYFGKRFNMLSCSKIIKVYTIRSFDNIDRTFIDWARISPWSRCSFGTLFTCWLAIFILICPKVTFYALSVFVISPIRTFN